MENLILQKRKMVQSRIEKSFESGLRISELQCIEKAHNVGDVHPNGKWVWTEIKPGKFDWRVKKNGDSNGSKGKTPNSDNAGTSEKKPQKKSVLDSKVNIHAIPNTEYRRITQHLEKKNPNASDAGRHLEKEAMNDKELKNFLAVAEHFSYSSQVNKLTREYCQKWAELARDEVRNRKAEKKTYKVNYVGADGKIHTEEFDDEEAAKEFRMNSAAARSPAARSFVSAKSTRN